MLLRAGVAGLALIAGLLATSPGSAESDRSGTVVRTPVNAGASTTLVIKPRGKTQQQEARIVIIGIRGQAEGERYRHHIGKKWTLKGLPRGKYRITGKPIEGMKGASRAPAKTVKIRKKGNKKLRLRYVLAKQSPPQQRPTRPAPTKPDRPSPAPTKKPTDEPPPSPTSTPAPSEEPTTSPKPTDEPAASPTPTPSEEPVAEETVDLTVLGTSTTFTESGTYTVPGNTPTLLPGLVSAADVAPNHDMVKIVAVGGGGGGGRARSGGPVSGTGGDGAVVTVYQPVIGGQTLDVTVGTGGEAGASNSSASGGTGAGTGGTAISQTYSGGGGGGSTSVTATESSGVSEAVNIVAGGGGGGGGAADRRNSTDRFGGDGGNNGTASGGNGETSSAGNAIGGSGGTGGSWGENQGGATSGSGGESGSGGNSGENDTGQVSGGGGGAGYGGGGGGGYSGTQLSGGGGAGGSRVSDNANQGLYEPASSGAGVGGSNGTSPTDGADGQVTITAVSSMPTTVSTDKPAAGQIEVSWDTPDDNGGAAITNYAVGALTTVDGTATTKGCTATAGGGNTCTITGLTSGQEIFIRLRAKTANGWGAYTAGLAVTPT